MRYALLGTWWLLIASLSLSQVLPAGLFSHQLHSAVIPVKVLTCPAWADPPMAWPPLALTIPSPPNPFFIQRAKDRQRCLEELFSDVPR